MSVMAATRAESVEVRAVQPCQLPRSWADINTECGEPSVAFIEGACVHEHVNRRWACADHADPERPRPYGCAACRHADGHQCLVHLKVLFEVPQ